MLSFPLPVLTPFSKTGLAERLAPPTPLEIKELSKSIGRNPDARDGKAGPCNLACNVFDFSISLPRTFSSDWISFSNSLILSGEALGTSSEPYSFTE